LSDMMNDGNAMAYYNAWFSLRYFFE